RTISSSPSPSCTPRSNSITTRPRSARRWRGSGDETGRGAQSTGRRRLTMTATIEPQDTAATATPQGASREGLIFEHSKPGRRGYQLPDLDVPEESLDQILPHAQRRDDIEGEVEVSEVDVIRHFTRLSKLNVS